MLKTAYSQLRSKYDDLWSLFARLKEGSAVEASALPERIRMEERMPETVLDMGLLDDASDDADSSGNAIVMAHNSA